MAETRIGFIDVVSPVVTEVLASLAPPGTHLELLARNTPQARLDLASRSDVLLVWAGPVHAAEIEAALRLRLVQKCGQGVENIGMAVATARGIPVCNVGGANARTVAEFAVLLMLASARHVRTLESDLRNGAWAAHTYRGVSADIAAKTVGIIGLGNIGKHVARRLRGWECRVLYHDIVRSTAEQEAELSVTYAPLDELLPQVDFLTLHVPLDDSTHGLIGARELAMLPRGARLINCSRGGVVAEAALADALLSGYLAGAALDVMEQEPLDLDSPLFGLPNLILTPHAAAGTIDSVRRVVAAAMDNVARVLAGELPLNIQNDVSHGFVSEPPARP